MKGAGARTTDASFVRLATVEEAAGRHWEPQVPVGWFVDDAWKVASPSESKVYRCRGGGHSRCHGRSVAALRRSHGRADWRWWFYCAAHSYGRIVEGGQVLEMRRLADGDGVRNG